jgi:EmrB/QacA subfamily drug resistance transporter
MRKGIILLLACLAQFMVIVDLAIVNVALPTIGLQMALNQSTLQWIVIAYGLLFGGFLLLGGRLGDVLGRRLVLLTGLGLFTIASLAAGLADSATLLIAARAVQGFGAALIAPSALSILASNFAEGKERNSALGIFGAVGGAAGSVGVLASGLLTDGPGWSWIFFINVPIGITLIALALKYLPKDTIKKGHKINLFGASSITGGLIAFVYGLNKGAEAGWSSPWTFISFAVAAALFVAFWRIESRSSAPLVPFSALKNRTSTATMITGLFTFGSLFSFIFMMTLFMQQQLHFSPTQTGFAWLLTSVSSFVMAMLTGTKFVAKISIKRILIISLSLMIAGILWLARAPLNATFLTDVLPALLLVGIGSGMAAPAIQIGALTGVKPHRIGLISGITETMRELGAVIAIAAVTTALVAEGNNLNGFHTGFLVMAATAALGLVTTGVAFQRRRRQETAQQLTESQEYA